MPPPAPPPAIAPSLLLQCPPLPEATSSLLPALLGNHDETAALYNQCRIRQADLALAAKTQADIAWEWYCKALRAQGFSSDDCTGRRIEYRGQAPP